MVTSHKGTCSSNTLRHQSHLYTHYPTFPLPSFLPSVLPPSFPFSPPISLSPKDRTIAVWDVNSPSDIVLRRVLVGHRAAVNVVDFDDKYIVSASGDRTIKVS